MNRIIRSSIICAITFLTFLFFNLRAFGNPVATIAATDSEAFEDGGDTGIFTVTLSQAAAADTTVLYNVTGTATPTSDYTALTGSLVISSGQSSGTITVTPVASDRVEGEESVIIELTANNGYTIGAQSSSIVTIYDFSKSTGTSYYVKTDGNDSNSGLSVAQAFKTIQQGVNSAGPGDTVYVLDGTYNNTGYTTAHSNGTTSLNNPVTVTLNTSGTAGNYVHLRSYPDGNSVKPKIMYDGNGGISIGNNVSYIVIDGFEIQGPAKTITYDQAVADRWTKSNYFSGRGIFGWGPSHHIYIRNCDSHHNCNSGIRMNKADYVVFENNIVSNNCWWTSSAESGMVLAEATNIDNKDIIKMLYTRNTLYNNWNRLPFCNPSAKGTGGYGDGFNYNGGQIIDGMGLYLTRNNATYNYGRMRMENNIAYNNGINGLVYHKTERGELVNNVLYMNGAWPGSSSFSGITMNTAVDVKVYNNILRARQSSQYAFKDNGGNSSIDVQNNCIPVGLTQYTNVNGTTNDPQFVNAPDLTNYNPTNYAPDAIDDAVKALGIDLHIQSSSPLIDAGTNLLAPGGDKDLEVRPKGNGIDIGMDEVEAPPNTPPTVNAGTDQTVTMVSGGGPWTPAETGTVAWYDANDSGTITLNGGAVSKWDDKSGNSNHAVQGTGSDQPTFNSSDTRLNNMPTIGYDQARKFLPTPTMTIKNIYFVTYYDDPDNLFDSSRAFCNDSTNTMKIQGSSTTANFQGGAGFNYFRNGATNSSNSALPMGPTLWTAKGTATHTNMDWNILAGSNSWQYWQYGAVGEIIFTDGTEDLATQQKIEGYLAHKWGLEGSLDASHPYKTKAPSIPSALANLDGTVTDPDDTPTTTWTKVNGSGNVTFGNASNIDTTATFDATGVYTLRLTADDGNAQTTDDVIITVENPTYSLTVNNGTGGGSYAEGAVVAITATVPGGQHFANWTGDTANLADPNSASTTVTMPASAVTVTANFASGDTPHSADTDNNWSISQSEVNSFITSYNSNSNSVTTTNGDITANRITMREVMRVIYLYNNGGAYIGGQGTVDTYDIAPAAAASSTPPATVTTAGSVDEGDGALIVSSTADSGVGSLRDAIAIASDGETIIIDGSLDTITVLSEIVVDKSITIDGQGVAIVSGENQTRIFRIENSERDIYVTLKNMGIVDAENGSDEFGGAIYNNGKTLTLDTVLLDGNANIAQSGKGGAVYSSGTLSIENCLFRNNEASEEDDVYQE